MSKKIKLKDLMNETFNISRIGGVVTTKPFHNNMSLSALVKEKYGEVEEQEIDVKGLTKEISNFNKLGETIFGKSNIRANSSSTRTRQIQSPD